MSGGAAWVVDDGRNAELEWLAQIDGDPLNPCAECERSFGIGDCIWNLNQYPQVAE